MYTSIGEESIGATDNEQNVDRGELLLEGMYVCMYVCMAYKAGKNGCNHVSPMYVCMYVCKMIGGSVRHFLSPEDFG